ncbi:MAG TPA: hypothetical protein VFU05_19945 [Cyclobacteriaceae bacterium]|nr:hypothetical protein [Cyclobacteriaceae bacterium]
MDLFSQKANDEKLRIVILSSDTFSPFVKIKDTRQRYTSILDFLGYSLKDKKTVDLLDKLSNYSDETTVSMMAEYLKLCANHEFSAWWSSYISYYQIQEELRKPINEYTGVRASEVTKMKLDISKDLSRFHQDLMQWEQVLFGDVKMKRAIAAQRNKIITYAEKYAESNSVE